MDWQDIAALMERLGLRRPPVAICYGEGRAPRLAPGETGLRACEGVLRASQGRTIVIAAGGSACRQLGHQLWLAPAEPADPGEAFEQLVSDDQDAGCFLGEVPGANEAPPAGLGEYLIMGPLETLADTAELVIFICTLAQASTLVALASEGAPPTMEMRGSICRRAIAFPLSTGRMNVTLMSNVGRRLRGYRADELLVSAPRKQVERMLCALPRLPAAPPPDIPLALRSLLRERCPASEN
jgi:uncharacterized protein (DUF169 family)